MKFQSLNKIFEQSFKDHWSRPALSNYQGETLKYGDLAQRVEYFHLAFEKLGLQKGDRVAICSKNQANWGVSFIAATTYGAVPVPILHEFKADSIHHLVNHSEAKAFFVDEGIWEHLSISEIPDVDMIVELRTLDFIHAGANDPAAFRQEVQNLYDEKYPQGIRPEDLCYHEDQADELAIINYTSGTSGFSKGVMIPYRALWNNVRFAREDAEPQMNCKSEVVSMLPSAHMYGLMFEFIFEMTIGAHVYFLTKVPSPKVILGAFADVHPDIIISVPLIIEKVYKAQVKPKLDKFGLLVKLPVIRSVIFNKVRSSLIEAFGGNFEEVILGGAAFNPEVEAFMNKVKFRFTVGYGMTECAPIITYEKWSKARLYSCGRPVKGIEVRIDSPDPQNIPGEVQVKGLNVFLGYYKDENATKATFTEDGWFRTGDMGVMDKDNYLYLKGRSKCMILGPSGQNIYPEELEGVINNAKYVADSLVVEDNGGLTALIYPDFNQAKLDKLSEEEVEKFINDSMPEINKVLPAYAQIRKVEFMKEDFERTPKKSIKRYLYLKN